MKNIFWTVLVLAVLIGLALVINNYRIEKVDKNVSEQESEVSAEGEVLGTDSEQIAFDGPYLVYVGTSEGQKTIAIPSMGLPMCPAFAAGNIADLNSISTGKKVEVKGTISADGVIIPCDSADHYLRIVE